MSVNSTKQTAPNAVRTNCAGGNPSEAVVLAVAEARDADPLDLEPLNSIIDADALNNLFSGRPSVGELHFSMADCDVVVHGNGDVVVTPPPTTADTTSSLTLHEG